MNIEVKIYVLKDPNTDEIRYIGRTKNFLNRRLNGHLSKAKTNKFRTEGVCPGNMFSNFSGSMYAFAIVPYCEGKLKALTK